MAVFTVFFRKRVRLNAPVRPPEVNGIGHHQNVHKFLGEGLWNFLPVLLEPGTLHGVLELYCIFLDFQKNDAIFILTLMPGSFMLLAHTKISLAHTDASLHPMLLYCRMGG